MENIERPEPLTTGDLLSQALQAIDSLLPEDWSTAIVAANVSPYADRRRNPDAVLEIEAPDQSAAKFALIARMTVTGRDVDSMLQDLRNYADVNDTQSIVVSRFVSSTVRDRLVADNVSYVDACGNLSVASPSPAIALFRPGLDRDPWRRTKTRQQLKGEPAARVVKTLFDEDPPIRVADLIELSGASAGATYRALDMLVEEGLVERGARGWIASVDRIAMLKRWAEDWAAEASKYAVKFTTLLGVDGTVKWLKREPHDSYVLGGRHAATLVADVGSPDVAVLHSDGVFHRSILPAGNLKPKDEGPDVIVIGRGLGAAQVGAMSAGKLRLASPAQAYADLILSGDRATAAKLLKKL